MKAVRALTDQQIAFVRARFGDDGHAMFAHGRMNTAEIACVLGVPESVVVRQALHRRPVVESFVLDPSEMPPPSSPAGGHAA